MRHPLVVGSGMNQKPTWLPPQFSQRCWFVGASPSTGMGGKRVSSSWMTVRPCSHLRGNLIIWPCWFQSMSAAGSQALKFILSHLSAELQSGRWTSTSHKQQTTMTICTSSLILHSPCCLGWSISSLTRPGLGPNAVAGFHTLRWVKRENMMVMLLKRLSSARSLEKFC